MQRTWSLRKCVYFCPQPTKTTGCPVTYTMVRAAPTLSSTVSYLDVPGLLCPPKTKTLNCYFWKKIAI